MYLGVVVLQWTEDECVHSRLMKSWLYDIVCATPVQLLLRVLILTGTLHAMLWLHIPKLIELRYKVGVRNYNT